MKSFGIKVIARRGSAGTAVLFFIGSILISCCSLVACDTQEHAARGLQVAAKVGHKGVHCVASKGTESSTLEIQGNASAQTQTDSTIATCNRCEHDTCLEIIKITATSEDLSASVDVQAFHAFNVLTIADKASPISAIPLNSNRIKYGADNAYQFNRLYLLNLRLLN